MKIIATSDWHLGNIFHGNDRIAEHRHFLSWLISKLEELRPDILLVAGDIFDNGNPSAAAQETYYGFIAEATRRCPGMHIVITAGNHDSANRLEAPRALLTSHRVEVRGTVRRTWNADDGAWHVDFRDLMIPVDGADGTRVVVLAVPFLRSDIIQGASYSDGVNKFLATLTAMARNLYPGVPLVMMAHMYAKGAEIAGADASERIVVGGQEEVNIDGWSCHPEYLTCGHIHKRQAVGHTTWARYTGSVLPMSFAERDYTHGVDLITCDSDGACRVLFLEYVPQHRLRVIPPDSAPLTAKQLARMIKNTLAERSDAALFEDFSYVALNVSTDKISNDDVKTLEALVASRNAVLCKTTRVNPSAAVTSIGGYRKMTSIDDILSRDPADTVMEAFRVRFDRDMTDRQMEMLRDAISELQQTPTPSTKQ